MKTVEVKLPGDSYRIHIGSGLLEQTGQRLNEIGISGRLIIITNPVVNELYGRSLEQSLVRGGFQVTVLEVPDGEEYKSLDMAGKLYQQLSDAYAERATPVLALGGGVIGDLAGFVAATYQRGIPLVQVPTTLLAQVDSSIGGKVAVNHGHLKNNVGAFYQPLMVITDTNTLKTLPGKEFSNGMAEVIKSAVIRDSDFFAFIEENLDNIKSLDDDALEEVVFRSAGIKAEVVEKDEKEAGLRSILNYGHTIGHGIETASDFEIAHGQAVAIGMLAAGRISHRMGILERDELDRLQTVIDRTGLPTSLPKLNTNIIIEVMGHDKKISQGKLRFVLPRRIGEVFITDEVSPDLVERVLVDWHEET